MKTSAKALRLCLAVGVVCVLAWGYVLAQPAKEQAPQKQAGTTNQVTPQSHVSADDFAEWPIDRLRTAAEQGNAAAQAELGHCYSVGDRVTTNFEEAVKWTRKAAEQGNARGQNILGVCYAKGQGVAQDYTEAAKWYRKAAEQGYAKAQSNLGMCYARGRGVAQDYTEAAKWYGKAAELGNAVAQNNLGSCYYNGRGVPQDYAEAVKWYRKAAEKGDAKAQNNLGMCYARGRGVAQDYTEAAKWYGKAAEQGGVRAQFALGSRYFSGEGVPQDYTEAAKWYRKAAEQGDAKAQGGLGLCYYHGRGVAQDYTEAAKWLRRAADQGEPETQYCLGLLYYNGEGVAQNDIDGYKWLCLAAAQGYKDSAEWRDKISQRMSRAEVVEGQRRAGVFVAKKEGTEAGSDGFSRIPEIGEGQMSAGTGFFVTDDGYLVTCEHVVRGASSFHVETASGSIPAKLVKKDRTIDVALMKVDGAFQALPVASEPRVKLGDAVFTIGFPNPDIQGVEPKLTRGEISSMAGVRDNPRYFQISVPVQPGNSGGALVDEYGNAVGVVTARLNDVATYEISGALPQNVNYAIKGGLVRGFLDKVPELSGKLKAPRTTRDREAASAAAERAAVLVIAE